MSQYTIPDPFCPFAKDVFMYRDTGLLPLLHIFWTVRNPLAL